jgi:hypothetical protein
MLSVKELGDLLYKSLDTKDKEEAIIKVVENSNLEKRLQICLYYSETYGKSLYSELKTKLSGHFKALAIHLFIHPITFYAKLLKKGLKSFGGDEDIILEALSFPNKEEMNQIESCFKTETGKDLIQEIEKNFSGVLKKNLINLISTPRGESHTPNPNKCEKLADLLISVGEGNWAGNDDIFKEVFIKSSGEELILIGRFYYKKTGKNMLDIIEKKITGKNKILLKEVLYNNIIPQELYAEKIYNSIKGLGTNNSLLARVLVLRHEIDMDEINEFYKDKYKKEMKDDIIGDTSGYFQKLCLLLAKC